MNNQELANKKRLAGPLFVSITPKKGKYTKLWGAGIDADVNTSGGFVSAIVTHKGKARHIAHFLKNLLANSGRDKMHAQVYTNTAAGTRGNGYIAVTTNTATPAATTTDLLGEITTGGLARADAVTKTHTASTNSTTIEHTFTASATHTAVHKSGLFDSTLPAGTMSHIANFTADATLVSGDTLKVTWTLNLG